MVWSVLKKFAALPRRAAVSLGRLLRRGRPPGRVVLRIGAGVLLLAVLVGLWWVNRALGLENDLWAPPGRLEVLRSIWLPMLFLLAMALFVLGRRLWILLGPEPDPDAFPDIDEAWHEAVAALDQAGVDLSERPIFLVLGRPASGEAPFFGASDRPMRVRQVPRRPDAPLSVYADDAGIYVNCPGASLLSRQSERLADQAAARQVVRGLPGRSTPPDPAADSDLSQGGPAPVWQPTENDLPTLGAPSLAVDQASTRVEPAEAEIAIPDSSPLASPDARRSAAPVIEPEAGSTFEVNDPEVDVAALLDEGPELRSEGADEPIPGGSNLLSDTEEVARISARLRHACHLISRARRPFCPINGVAVLLPMAATDTEPDLRESASLCRLDLEAVRETLQLIVPSVVVVCDLESLPGGPDLIERVPSSVRRQAFGRSFPLRPDVAANDRPHLFDRGVRWIGGVLLPALIYDLFRLDEPVQQPEGTPSDTIEPLNVRLYRLMFEIRRRENRISRFLTRGVVFESHDPPMLGGCYLAGTGFDAAKGQGFVSGVFRLLIDNQDYVSWTDRILAEEEDYRRWTNRGYVTLGLFLLAVATLVMSRFLSG